MNNKYDFEDNFISKLEMKRNVGFMPPGAGRGRGGSGSGGGRGGVSGGGRDRGGSRESGQTDPHRPRTIRAAIQYVQAPPPPNKTATGAIAQTPAPAKAKVNTGGSKVVKGADGKYYRVKNRSKTASTSGQGREPLQ